MVSDRWGTTMVSKCTMWYGTERQNGSQDRGISEWEKEVRSRLRWMASLPPQTIVISGPGLLLGPMSRITILVQLRSLLMSVAPEITKGEVDGTIQTSPHPSLAATLGRAGPAPHRLKHSGERILHFTWTTQQN